MFPPQSEHERHPGNVSEERRGVAHRRAQRRGQGDRFYIFIFLNVKTQSDDQQAARYKTTQTWRQLPHVSFYH